MPDDDEDSAMMRRPRCGFGCLTLLLAVLALPAAAHADATTEPHDATLDLHGLANVTLGVTQLTPDGAQCGLDITQIGHAAGHMVADAGIAVSAESANRMTVSAITTRVGPDQCATAAMLGVYTKESFFSSTAGWVQNGYVVVWQRSLMVATPIGQHAAAVIGATQRLSEQFLADWHAQNAPPARTAAAPGQPMAMTTKSAAVSPPAAPAAANQK